MAFNARFPGTCATCGDPIERGESVEYEDDQIVHAVPAHCTGKVGIPAPRAAIVCERCWLTKPCECDS